MIIAYIILLIFFCFLLVKATDILLINFKGLSEKTHIAKFALTSLILALGTSLPEFFVSVVASAEGQSSLALGNIIGSNIANFSLIIGGAALIGGVINIKGDFLKKDVFYAFLAGTSPMLLLFDKVLSRTDGLILLALYFFYNIHIFREKSRTGGEDFVRRLLRRLNHRSTYQELGWIFLSIALLLFCAEILVKIATKIAISLGLPVLLIGLFLVALGTSLPELAFELKAVRAKQAEMVFGDLLGSVVANATLIIGVACLISPIRISAFKEYLLATMVFVIIFGLFYFFIRTKKRLERWEGALLIIVYFLFIVLEFTR